MAAIIGGIMKAEPKKHLWQFLDGKLTVLPEVVQLLDWSADIT